MGACIFTNCVALTSVYIRTKTVDNESKVNNYENSWFLGCNDVTLYVPQVHLEDIDTAQQNLETAYGPYWNYTAADTYLLWDATGLDDTF